MSAEASEDPAEGESSRRNVDCAGDTDICLDSNTRNGKLPSSDDANNLKKANMRKLIERYFYQLMEGCENKNCRNRHCKSSGQVAALTPNQAAAKALQLFFQGASLCRNDKPHRGEQGLIDNSHGNNILMHDAENSSSSASNNIAICDNVSKAATRGDAISDAEASPRRVSVIEGTKKSKEFIDENIILAAFAEGLDDTAFSHLIHKLGIAFSTVENIAGSFQVKEKAPLDHVLDRASQMKLNEGLKTLTKEQLRTLEDDQDKDEDSCAGKTPPAVELFTTKIDFPSLRRTFRHLFALPDMEKREKVISTLNSVLGNLVECMPLDIQCAMSTEKVESIITASLVIFDVICLERRDLNNDLAIGTCETLARLKLWAQARVARIWSVHCTEHFKVMLEMMQDLISCQVVNTLEFDDVGDKIEDNDTILHVVQTMKVLYYANILAGDYETSRRLEENSDLRYLGLEYDDEDDPFLGISNDDSMIGGHRMNLFPPDPLATELDIGVMDSRKPLIPFAEFYNEVLSEMLEMDQDYMNYYNIRMLPHGLDTDHDWLDSQPPKTSFMMYPFVLTPMKKTLAMYFHSRIRMYSEGRISILNNHLSGQPINPYLKLKVRRDHLIEDALIELELIAVNNAKDLKKQLVVEFIGEQGVDEGGVSKEFFQLIVEQIFNPEYGMFLHHEDSEMFWINSTSFENDAQFSLIGIVLGLAIYNNIILAVNFPMVIYRKLMGVKGSFKDLSDWNPNLYSSLSKMLEDEESDFEDVYMQTFEITYKDVFENVIPHELKKDGATIMVTQENKLEFVELYADFLLNESIEKQFKAFRKGFQMVMGAESPLNMLFRPDEVELLVCGSKQFDVTQLHKATEYENGYSAETQIIKDFWEVVYEMPIELQRKLLEFSTGSDRVPIGGLSNLKLVIARHGPDSDRLPTSHTCYNILLLPEYDSKEKLKDRLLKAINFSKGFGML